jgi:signal transduction histidine kinase/DNA-binding NarL/FixJ family response regulator
MDAYLPNETEFKETPLEEKTVRILLVEDNPGDVVIMKELLRKAGIDYSMRHVSTLRETLMVCLEESFDIILLDLGLPDSVGAETLKKILVFNTGMPVVVMTGLDDEDTALESLRQGAQDYLVKSRLTSDILLRGIKYGIERKKIHELLKKNAMQFSMLSSTTSAINECEDIPSIYHVACRNIVQILYKAGVAGFTLDTPQRIFASGTEVFDNWYQYIESHTGIDLDKSVIHHGEQPDFLKALLKDGKLHRIPAHLPYSPGSDKENEPAQAINTGNSLLLYIIGFTRNEIIYGGALIIVYSSLGDDDINIVETVCNQVSLSLHRKAIEKDLKNSEDRFRKLSKELELKVKERTHDLESANYLLNQELIERHLAEESLKKSESSLKELNATKDKFFSIIAHDLKNPFTCLLGSTEVLNEKLASMDTKKIRDLVQIINDSARSGYSVLQNLLVWSKSQTGMITFSPEQVDLKKVIDDCIYDLKGCYPRKEINIVTETTGEMNLFADRNMVATILRNLIDNSLKFTPIYGTIKIKAENRKDEAVISISDTGIGIPEENLKDLFRLDRKFTRPGTNKEQGTGLGLKICREFIEMQGGTITVRSTVNKGSEFVFTIPLRNK